MTYNEWVTKYFFPVRLKSLREKKEKHQEHIAHALRVNHRTISHWEKGRAQPSLSLLFDLASELQVDVKFLLCQDYETQKKLQLAVLLNNDMLIEENDCSFDVNGIIYFDGGFVLHKLKHIVATMPYDDSFKIDEYKMGNEIQSIYHECLERINMKHAYTMEMLSVRRHILFEYAKSNCDNILDIFVKNSNKDNK